MSSISATELNRQERILVFLKKFGSPYIDEMGMPFTTTAYGISSSLGISRQNVSNVLKTLEEMGQVTHVKSHIRGNNQKMNAYILELPGMERALEVEEREGCIEFRIHVPRDSANQRKAKVEIDDAIRMLADQSCNRSEVNRVISKLTSAIGYLLKEVA